MGARALLDRLVFAHAATAAAQAEGGQDLGGERPVYDEFLDVRLRGELKFGHGFFVEPANGAGVCKGRSIALSTCWPAAAIRRSVRDGALAFPCSSRTRRAVPTPSTKPGGGTSTTSCPTARCSSDIRIRRWCGGSTPWPRTAWFGGRRIRKRFVWRSASEATCPRCSACASLPPAPKR